MLGRRSSAWVAKWLPTPATSRTASSPRSRASCPSSWSSPGSTRCPWPSRTSCTRRRSGWRSSCASWACQMGPTGPPGSSPHSPPSSSSAFSCVWSSSTARSYRTASSRYGKIYDLWVLSDEERKTDALCYTRRQFTSLYYLDKLSSYATCIWT